MPFHVGDYLGDTGHLSTTQHGAYLLLILHYWRTGGLPAEDAKLARICKLSVKSWVELIKPDLERLFRPGWRHKRIDEELEKFETTKIKRAIAGRRGGIRSGAIRTVAKVSLGLKHAKNEARLGKNEARLKQPEPEPVKEKEGASDEAVTAKPPTQTTRAEFEKLLATRKGKP